MVRFLVCFSAVLLPLCASTRSEDRRSKSPSHGSDVCSVEEVPTHHQFGISFAYKIQGGCSNVQCNNHYFFRDVKSDKGLADFIVTRKEGLTCHCFVSGKYSNDGQDRGLITYLGGDGVRKANQCTAHTCWEHYASLRYFIDLKTRKEAANLESPGSNNHWVSECKDSSKKSPGVSIQSVQHLVRQLEKEGHEDVLKAVEHLFVHEDKHVKVFAGGFRLDDQVWWNDTGLVVLGSDGVVKYGSDGRIVDGEVGTETVTVHFVNNPSNIVVPADKLSNVALNQCFGGFCVDDIVYYIGDDMTWPAGSTLAWSSEGVVVAPTFLAPDDVIRWIYVKFGPTISSTDVTLLSKTKPVEHLPGDFKRGQLVYYRGETLEVEGRSPITYGLEGVVGGPSKDLPKEEVLVIFEDKRIYLQAWTLSTLPLAMNFSGGLALGDKVYYTGSRQHLACELDLAYGHQGFVIGGADRPELVSVRFDGLTYRTELSTQLLSKEAPPMGAGFSSGECVYLKEDVTIPGGDKLLVGHKGRIAKGSGDTSRVVVKFDGFAYLVDLAIDKVQSDPPIGVLYQRASTANVLSVVQEEVKYVGR